MEPGSPLPNSTSFACNAAEGWPGQLALHCLLTLGSLAPDAVPCSGGACLGASRMGPCATGPVQESSFMDSSRVIPIALTWRLGTTSTPASTGAAGLWAAIFSNTTRPSCQWMPPMLRVNSVAFTSAPWLASQSSGAMRAHDQYALSSSTFALANSTKESLRAPTPPKKGGSGSYELVMSSTMYTPPLLRQGHSTSNASIWCQLTCEASSMMRSY